MESYETDYPVSFDKLCVNENSNYKDIFYKAFNISPVLMAISTIESGVYVDVNRAWLDTLGYRKEEVVGRSSRELNTFVDYQERQAAKQLIIENGTARDQEIRILTKSGDIRHAIFSGDIISMEGRYYLLTTAYDITDRKHMLQIEDKNRLLREQLKYDSLKANFLANISHELKTPVNIIFSSLQLCSIIMHKDSVEEIRNGIQKQADIMRQNCYRLIRLVNNLIDITKAGSGYIKLNLENCNIVSLIRNIANSVSEYGSNNGIDINFSSDEEQVIIACDMEKVERIILNLLSNAIKFTPRKGSVNINVSSDKDEVRISVRDTGIGIPKFKQKNLFRRFYQVNSSFTRPNEGSGIGLSLSKSLAELHNGNLYINDKYKNGCEFILELPVKTLRKSRKKNIKSYRSCHVDMIKVEFSDIYFDM